MCIYTCQHDIKTLCQSCVFDCRCEDIVEGEPAELLVLSQDDTFFNFKVSSAQCVRVFETHEFVFVGWGVLLHGAVKASQAEAAGVCVGTLGAWVHCVR